MSVNLASKLKNDLTVALKNKQTEQSSIIRLILNEFNNFCIDNKITPPIGDNGAVKILTKMAKQRKESIDQFISANRNDLADKEQFELDYISSMLPKQLDYDQLHKIVTDIIIQDSITSMSQMKDVMLKLSNYPAGVIDKSQVAKIIKDKLANTK